MLRSRSAAAAVKDDDGDEEDNLIPNDGGGSSVSGGYGATGNAMQQETSEQRRARIRCERSCFLGINKYDVCKEGRGSGYVNTCITIRICTPFNNVHL